MEITIEERVAKGIEMLNRQGPLEWWDQIEVNRLFLMSRTQCVLGQLYGDYENGLAELGLMNEIESEMVGFSAPFDEYMDLTHQWRHEVEKIQVEVRQ